MQTVTVTEAAEKLTELIDAALRGEEIVITKGDCLIRLTPNKLVKNRQPGTAKGQVWMSDDFDEPLEEFKEYME
jgi:antitoxin (DNA-binding transcriptional repressor) of toxin-antitoxin stability system